jgi:hypothetical protein
VTHDQQSATLSGMAAVVTPRVYQHRPVLVIADLADLRGPAAGTVELPIWLFWSAVSAEQRTFSLDDPVSRGALYRTVIREARRPADLTGLLDRATLVRMWPDLSWRLPKEVQAAWEGQHPVLQARGRRREDVLRAS